MAPWFRVLAAKPNSLNSIPRAHVVEAKKLSTDFHSAVALYLPSKSITNRR